MMESIELYLTKEQLNLLKRAAKIKGMGIKTFIKWAVNEEIKSRFIYDDTKPRRKAR